MVADDRLFDMVVLSIAAELEQQAVLQVGGGDAGGLETANSLKGLPDLFGGRHPLDPVTKLVWFAAQVAPAVEAADDVFADLPDARGNVLEPQLLGERLLQTGGLVWRVLQRGVLRIA